MSFKTKLKYIALTSLAIFSLGGVVFGSFAWFQTAMPVDTDYNIGGESLEAYFAYGDGTEQHPYGISTFTHLRNLAWLQYNGSFKNNSGEQIQCYFELANDIDCTGKTLPPIGTEEYPFIGHFSGIQSTDQSQTVHSIQNLTVSNKEVFSDKPATITDYTQPEIVGLFGVVGKLNDKPVTSNSYDSSINKLVDFVIEDITVESKTTSTLIGIAAGYSNGEMSNVSVKGTATLDVGGQSHTAKAGFHNQLTDYGLVGYTTNVGGQGTYKQELSQYYHKGDSSGGDSSGGDGNNWGGTLRFDEYNSWIYSIFEKGNALTTNPYNSNYRVLKTVNNSSSGNEEYKIDYTAVHAQSWIDPLYDYEYYFHYEGNTSSGSTPSFFYIYLKADGNEGGYMRYTNNSFYEIEKWEVNNNAYYSHSFFGIKAFKLTLKRDYTNNGNNYRTIYLNKYNSKANSYQFALYSTESGHDSTDKIGNWMYYKTSAADPVYRLRDGCYLPLKLNSFSSVYSDISSKNTGYLVGKSVNNSANGSPKLGSYNISSISKSINAGSTSTYSDANCEIITYDTASSSWVRIKDSHNQNSSNTNLNSAVSTTKTPSELKLMKYEAYESQDITVIEKPESPLARNSLKAMLTGANRINGLHFDGGAISSSAITSVSHAMINGNETSLDFAKGSLDFSLKKQGYINFFAGTYNQTNASSNFFSLYKVDRSSGFVLNEIFKIYENTASTSDDDKYYYEYDANGNSHSSGTKGSLVFDVNTALRLNASGNTSTSSNYAIAQNALFYFEIPIDKGEYAMGMVSAGSMDSSVVQGAYMIYLDIGASAQELVSNEVKAYAITTTSTSYTYPLGVDFAATTISGNGGESICICIATNKQGVVVFTIDSVEHDIGIDDETTPISSFSYKSANCTDSDPPAASGEFSLSGDTISGPAAASTVITRVLTIDIQLIGNNAHHYVAKVTDELNAQGTITSSDFVLSTDGGSFQTSTQSAIETILAQAYAELNLSGGQNKTNLRELTKIATLTRESGTGEFTAEYNTANCTEDTINVTVTSNGATYSIAVISGYHLTIGNNTYDGPYPS